MSPIRVVILLAFGGAGWTASPAPNQVLHILNEGVQPILTAQQFQAAREDLEARFAELRSAWADEAVYTQNQSCVRFARSVRRLSNQIAATALALGHSPDPDVQLRARLFLLAPLHFGLHGMFRNGVEGGFSLLDRYQKQPCPFVDRKKVEEKFSEAARKLATFMRDGVGHPGLQGFDHMNSELLSRARMARDQRQRKQWGLFAATAAMSVFFWQTAPPAALMAARLAFAGSIPPLLGSGVAVFGIRAAALATEGLAYDQLDRTLLPSVEAASSSRKLGSWEDQIGEVETMLDSPLSSPELYSSGITQIQAQLSWLYQPWLRQNPENRNTLAARLAREASSIAGLNQEQSAEKLQYILATEYGYQVECETGVFGGVDELACFAVTRRIARAIYNSPNLPRLDPAQKESLKILVAPESDAAQSAREDYVELRIGERLTSENIHLQIQAALSSPIFIKNSSVARAFASDLEYLQGNSPTPIAFDSSLTRAQKWKFIHHLIDAVTAEPALLDRPADVLFVTKRFRRPYRADRRIEENVDVSATPAQLQNFLRRSAIDSPAAREYLDKKSALQE